MLVIFRQIKKPSWFWICDTAAADGVWGDLKMKRMPVWMTKCMRCQPNQCTKSYPEPFCVHNCPTRALSFGDLDDPEPDVAKKAAALREAGRRFFTIPEFEGGRPGVQYVNRK